MKGVTKEVIKAINQGLLLWGKWIDTRQDAYERKMDKHKRKAINYAEQFINLYYDTTVEEESKSKVLRRKRDLFFKYNN